MAVSVVAFVAFLLTVVRSTIDTPLEAWEEYFEHYTFLRADRDYRLYWKILEDETTVEIGLEVATTGWVGFGISDDSTMGGADIIMGWVDDNQDKYYLQRRHSVSLSRRFPVFDEDLTDDMLDAWQEDGVTRLHFKRALFPCADEEDPFVKQIIMGTTFVIFAFNQNDPICNGEDDVKCDPLAHDMQSMGSQSVNFFSGESSVVAMPDEYETFDFLMGNYSVPPLDTTYHCKFIHLPEAIQNATHLIRMDPIIQEGNEGAVHHIIVYWCTDFDEEYMNFEEDCNEFANMPDFAGKHCRSEVALSGWAVGAADFYFPEDVGFPIQGFQYALLEIHYDNPDELTDIVDSSGMRLYWTQELREYDAGRFAAGAPYSAIWVPGDTDAAISKSYHSAPECSLNSDMDPDEGVNVFVGLLHSHTIGVAMKLRHIRNNVELPPLLQNDQYDFNYQQWVSLPNEVKIYPGDEFVCECVYKTERTYPTYGGQSTRDEMCNCGMYYYPASSFRGGFSRFTDEQYEGFFQTAIDNGWFNGTTSWTENEQNKNAFYYNGSNPDAMAHYLEFIGVEERAVLCAGCPNGTCENYVIPEARDEFVALPPEDFGDCESAQQGGEGGDRLLTDDEVIVVSVAAAVVALIAVVICVVYCKR
eukprot:CAMPEP_0197021526 /NCGR_PEP_ID=MMETSP1384-20130603/2418_1 /TAXON_ID=29189 /ORGANISM="Ammonia sp." /LENGTH=642 /DNA_ID=CAMNT_0042449369 /DNA_START=26 /DNA_END=1950 /DNA_ORIENTATION=-